MAGRWWLLFFERHHGVGAGELTARPSAEALPILRLLLLLLPVPLLEEEEFDGLELLPRGPPQVAEHLQYGIPHLPQVREFPLRVRCGMPYWRDRKSTRLNSSHVPTSHAAFCL